MNTENFTANLKELKSKHSDLDFSGLSLVGVDFSGLDLTDVKFDNSDLTGAQLHSCKLEGTSFRHTNLSKASFTCARLNKVNFTQATLTYTDFSLAEVKSTIMCNADMRTVRWYMPTFHSVDFSGSWFTGANIKDGKFAKCNFGGADFDRASLIKCVIEECYCFRTNFKGVDFTRTFVSDTLFECADLSEANLYCAAFYDVRLNGSKMDWINLRGSRFTTVDLRQVKGLIAVGPIGSRGDILYGIDFGGHVKVKTGCFCDTWDKFSKAVKISYGDTAMGARYKAAANFILAWWESFQAYDV